MPLLKQLSIKAFYDSDSFSTSKMGKMGNFTGTVSKRYVLTIEKRDYQPTENFRMPYQSGIKCHLAMESEQLVAARIIPFTDDSASDTQSFEQLLILIDSSASQASFLFIRHPQTGTLPAVWTPQFIAFGFIGTPWHC